MEVLHWAPAHTSGDLVVYLPSEKIVFTGDIITTQPDALIHLEKNGSSEGWVTTAKGIAALNADQFVPGHGDVMTKADIQKKATDVAAKRAKIKDLVAQGKSLAEIRTAVGDPPPAQGKAAAADRDSPALRTWSTRNSRRKALETGLPLRRQIDRLVRRQPGLPAAVGVHRVDLEVEQARCGCW